MFGVGTEVANALLVTAGDNPISTSPGWTERHRLNRGGNRRLNRALYIVALTQTRHDPRAVAYLARRRAEGKTAREGIRALKRHLSDVVYQQMRQDLGPALTHRSSDLVDQTSSG